MTFNSTALLELYTGIIREVHSLENEKDNFKQVMRTVVETYGIELLNDARRTNALLMDYAPRQFRERKLIFLALQEGIGNELIRAIGKEKQDQKLCVNRCVRCLVDEVWITEEAAQFAVGVIAFAIDINSAEIPQVVVANSIPTLVRSEKELKKGAFDHKLTNIKTILSQYQVIGYKAFATDQSLKDLELPQGIKTIKAKAFVDCINLKRIVLPSTIEEIGVGSFTGCDSLETISLNKNANYTFIKGMLIDKKRKALMRVTNVAAEQCIIPQEITSIQAKAFERSSVKSVVLPKSLTELARDAFSFCGKLQRFDIDFHNQFYLSIDGVLHTRDCAQLVRFPSGYQSVNYIIEDTVSYIADGAFCGTANIESITFASNLKSIGSRAFEYCRKLSSLVLPSSVEIIGERAFQYCDRLSSIMLPRSIHEIGDFAFCGCSSIQAISIPKGVKRIGHAAFKDCSSLRKIIIQDNVEFIGDGAFVGCSDDMEIAIKNNSYVERYCSAHKITWSAL